MEVNLHQMSMIFDKDNIMRNYTISHFRTEWGYGNLQPKVSKQKPIIHVNDDRLPFWYLLDAPFFD